MYLGCSLSYCQGDPTPHTGGGGNGTWPPFVNSTDGTGEHSAVLGSSGSALPVNVVAGLFQQRCDLFDTLPYPDPN